MASRYAVMLWSGALVGVVLALWLASGRGSLTKASRSVSVQVRDDVFGDVMTRDEFERGPIFGYFIGLDAVAATTAAGMIATGIAWFLPRLRSRRNSIETRRLT